MARRHKRPTKSKSNFTDRLPVGIAGIIGITSIVALAIWFWRSHASSTTEASVDRLIDFQQYQFGVPPTEFEYTATGPHGPVLSSDQPMWRTYVDSAAPSPKYVIMQASMLPEADHYPLALLHDVQAADLMLAVYIKPMGGDMDQSAGVVWRARDKDNYYFALIDPQQDRLRLLKMVQGHPSELSSVTIPIDVEFERREPSPTWGWYALRVETVGQHISVWFQDVNVIDTTDATFTRAGQIGLITHADAVAAFDDLYIQMGRTTFVIPTPRPTSTPISPPTMHVASLMTTQVDLQTPQTEFDRDEPVYWKVLVLDAKDAPVPGAVVKVNILRKDGTILDSPIAQTGTDGLAWFYYAFPSSASAGSYTLEVADVSHSEYPDAIHDSSADSLSDVIFRLR